MRKQIIMVVLLSFFLLLATATTITCLTKNLASTARYSTKNEGHKKTTETLWEVLTRQLIGAVSLSR